MNYFQNCRTQEEIKKEYRRLCKIHHPDLGGDEEIMKELNRQYAVASDNAVRREKPNWTESQYQTAANVAEKVREAIERIITIPGLQIEICGLWVWVGGDTKPNKEALKSAGYKWARKKEKWYYAGVPSRNKGRRWSMDEIRGFYGSQRVPSPQKEEDVAYAS